MAVDEYVSHDDSAGAEESRKRHPRGRGSYVRNSIDGSSIGNAVQAHQISGGVHFYGVSPSGMRTPQDLPAIDNVQNEEPLQESETRKPSPVAEYFRRIFKERSPILIGSVLAMSANMAIVGLVEYMVGAQLPGESPSNDLQAAQAGTFFAVISAILVLWRYFARRNGSDKWRSLGEVHSRLVGILRSRLLIVFVIAVLVLLMFFLFPTLWDPASLTTSSSTTPSRPNNATLSDFGYALVFILILLQVAVFCVYVNIRHSDTETPDSD